MPIIAINENTKVVIRHNGWGITSGYRPLTLMRVTKCCNWPWGRSNAVVMSRVIRSLIGFLIRDYIAWTILLRLDHKGFRRSSPLQYYIYFYLRTRLMGLNIIDNHLIILPNVVNSTPCTSPSPHKITWHPFIWVGVKKLRQRTLDAATEAMHFFLVGAHICFVKNIVIEFCRMPAWTNSSVLWQAFFDIHWKMHWQEHERIQASADRISTRGWTMVHCVNESIVMESNWIPWLHLYCLIMTKPQHLF